MKQLNMEKFKEMKPCTDGYEFVLSLKTTDLKSIFTSLENKNLTWSNWLLARLLRKKDKIRYAVFAASEVLHIFESSYPDDPRPRKAIEAAKECIADDSEKNRQSAWAAADAAGEAAATVVTEAAVEPKWAAGAAVRAAEAAVAAGAAVRAAGAAVAAARAAGAAAGDASAEMMLRIVNYGLSLLFLGGKECVR